MSAVIWRRAGNSNRRRGLKLFKIKLKIITALFEAKLPVMFVSGISLIWDPKKRCLFNLIQAKKLVFIRILAPYVNRKKTSAIL